MQEAEAVQAWLANMQFAVGKEPADIVVIGSTRLTCLAMEATGGI